MVINNNKGYQLDERVTTVRNIEKDCFNCGVAIYINPKVRKDYDMNKLAILDTVFRDLPNEEPNLHTCKPKSEVKNPYQTTDVSSSSNLYPDQSPQATEKTELIKNVGKKDNNNNRFASVNEVGGRMSIPFPNKDDFERLEKKVNYMSELLEAVIRGFDKELNKAGKVGPLFTKASNLQDTNTEKNIPKKDPDFIDEPVTPPHISSKEEVIKHDDGFLEDDEDDGEVIIER